MTSIPFFKFIALPWTCHVHFQKNKFLTLLRLFVATHAPQNNHCPSLPAAAHAIHVAIMEGCCCCCHGRNAAAGAAAGRNAAVMEGMLLSWKAAAAAVMEGMLLLEGGISCQKNQEELWLLMV